MERIDDKHVPQLNRPYSWEVGQWNRFVIRDCLGFSLDPEEVVSLLNGEHSSSSKDTPWACYRKGGAIVDEACGRCDCQHAPVSAAPDTNGVWVCMSKKLHDDLREIVNYEGWQGAYFTRLQAAIAATRISDRIAKSATNDLKGA